MFQGRRRGALQRAIGGADVVVEGLTEKITARHEKIARLELELFDLRASLEAFRVERDRRLGLYLARAARLEEEIGAARREADYRAVWGNRADAPDFRSTVSEQYRKAWTSARGGTTGSGPAKLPPPVDMEELRQLYRSLAKRFHPDLTTDPAEKIQRQEVMAKINQAYMEQDQERLKELANKPEIPDSLSQPRREHQVLDLHREIDRLDELILKLEQQINELNSSDDLQMALEYNLAQYEGRDLIGEHVKYYEKRIRELEQELVSYRP